MKWLEDLKKTFSDELVSTDQALLASYGLDATTAFEPNAAVVVRPHTTAEVSDFLKWAHQNNVSVVPSGGRTGLSGGAVARTKEAVLSMERLNQLGELDTIGQTIEVGAGVITQTLLEHCEAKGLTWPIDLSAKGSSQIGGNIATNAGGILPISQEPFRSTASLRQNKRLFTKRFLEFKRLVSRWQSQANRWAPSTIIVLN